MTRANMLKSILISDTNSTLYIEFRGNFTEAECTRVLNVVEKEIVHQTIYYNDLSGKEYSFDYKSSCGYWIENINYTDSLCKVYCVVCECTKEV